MNKVNFFVIEVTFSEMGFSTSKSEALVLLECPLFIREELRLYVEEFKYFVFSLS